MDYFGLYRVIKAARNGMKLAKAAQSARPLLKIIAAPMAGMVASGACEEILDEALDKIMQEK